MLAICYIYEIIHTPARIHLPGTRRGEGRVLNKVLCREAPRFKLYIPSVGHFERKSNPFHTPTIDTMHLFSGESAQDILKDLSKDLKDKVFLLFPYFNSL